MPASETVTIDTLEQFGADLDLLGISWEPALRRCAVAARADILSNFAGSHDPDGRAWPAIRPRIRGGNKPLMDTGILRASSTGRGGGHVEEIDTFSLTFGSNDERAPLHQHGGTVKPIRAKALTIPLTKDALRYGGARNFPKGVLFLLKPADSRHTFLAEQKGKGKRAKLIFHYVLVFQVKIPARPFVGWSKSLLETVEEILADYVEKKRG